MRKLFTFVLALMAFISVNADELYLVGDGTHIGWTSDGTQRQLTRMAETNDGVYVWTGLLKHGNEGFKICNSTSGWDGYHPSSENFAIAESGVDNYTSTGNDWKWNPSNGDWKWYTITFNKNEGTFSWQADSFTPLEAVDGVISIGTAEELNKLAIMCRNNINSESYKVKLTADIDYTAYKDGASAIIGNVENMPFKGEFDGQNHTITVDITTCWTRSGLFGTIAENSKVHNLKVAGKITATNKNQTGGICGLLKGGAKIYNCISAAEIVDNQSGDGTIGGISAVTYNASTIENCAFFGKISAPNRDGNGGILSWSNNGSETTIKNCLIVADINWAAGDDFGRNNPSIINSYKTGQNDAQLASGELTYILNSKESGAEDWFQTLGTDAMPTPLSSSEKIYANGSFYCDGVTPKGGDVVFANTNESVVAPHVFGDDGVCTGCYAAGQEAEAVDGVFQLNNAGNLLWWAQYVNAGNPASNAALTVDADLSAAKYIPAGNTDNKYVGTFDAQGHAVTMALNNPDLNYQGLFGVATDGATIKNVVVKGSVTGKNYVGGIVGGSGGSAEDKKLSIINCGNEATITATEANGAGIIGVNMSGAAHFYILNCYTVGNITSARESGAITGWTGGEKSTIENTYNIGVVKNGADISKDFVRGGGNLVNTYNLSTNDATVESGELAYKLGEAFSQEIGTDAYPVFGSAPVYAVGDAGYSTLYDETSGYELNGDVNAYVAVKNPQFTNLILTKVENVPASTAVILKGTYYNKKEADLAALNITNELKGTASDTQADGTMYVLAKPEGEEVGFYLAENGTTIPAGKAYYQASTPSVKAYFFAGEGTTAITNVNGNKNGNNDAIYNIAGQRVSKLQKGINIVNGRKVLY